MQASLSSTRSFLSTRGKLKSLHRRKNSTDSNSTTHSSARPDSQVLSTAELGPDRNREKPDRASKLLTTQTISESRSRSTSHSRKGSQEDGISSAAAQWSKASYDQFTEAQSEKQFVSTDPRDVSEPRTSEETMKEVQVTLKPFQGLDYPLEFNSTKGLIDDDFFKSFGITMSRGGSTDGMKKELAPNDMLKVQVPKSSGAPDVYEMEVPLQLLKGRTPELEVSVPFQRPNFNSNAYIQGSNCPVPQSAVSVLSPHSRSETAAHLSVVSPVEAVESPKPRRPFSTASIEGLTKGGSSERKPIGPPIPSANSTSSAGTMDGKSPGNSRESPRSSMSSVNSDTGLPKLHSEQHPDVVEAMPLKLDTASLYHAALSPKPGRTTSPYQQNPQRPMMHRTGSATSLQSTASTRTHMSSANVNKPLPPEPKRLSTISSIPSEDSSSASRSSMITLRPTSQPHRNGQALPTSSARSGDVGRINSTRSSISGASLRSKYTPKDLDALDDAFIHRNPPTRSRVQKSQSPTSLVNPPHLHTNQSSGHSTLSKDKTLGSISEEPGRDKQKTSSKVTQISRGPMKMRPTRRAPQPPKTPRATTGFSPSSPKAPRLATRSHSSNHISGQYRETSDLPPQLPQRSTTLIGGSTSKADRILGREPGSGAGDHRDMFGTDWVRSESPQNMNSTHSSRLSSRDEIQSPELERSPADAYFYEVQKRLELLSPKNDTNTTFQAFQGRQAPAMRSSEALRPEDADLLAREIKTETAKAQVSPDEENSSEEDAASPTHMESSRDYETDFQHETEPKSQTFIAELEAPHIPHAESHKRDSPEPAELQGSEIYQIAELGLPSPGPLMSEFSKLPVPPEPASSENTPNVTAKRGRVNTSNTFSTTSAKSRSLHSQGSFRVRSLASLAASEIPDIYAHLPSKHNSARPSMTSMSPEEVEMLVSAETAERVLLRILESLDNLGDLFAAALVSRGFYRTFKRHELHLLKLTISKVSMAAWELRQMSIPYEELDEGTQDYTPELYFHHYVRDLMTMVELKALILDHCQSFLRPDTIASLAGETNRSQAMDEAFWRVWTFCRLFGCGSNREDDIVGQMDWLKGGPLAKQSTGNNTIALSDGLAKNSVLFNPPEGFAKGNGPEGLSSEELRDMFELWTCLGVLLQGFQSECEKARAVGVFDNANVPEGDKKEFNLLEEWTYHLLANAPSTILDVVSPKEPTAARFSKAQAQGHTNWTPSPDGSSKSMFLKEAIMRVSKDKAELERSSAAASSPRSFSNLPQVVTPPSQTASSPDPFDARQRIQAYGDEIRARKQEPSYSTLPISPDRPMSDANNVLERLDSGTPLALRAPSLAQRFSRRKGKAKAPLGSMAESPAESSSSSTAPNRANMNANFTDRIASLHKKVSGREPTAPPLTGKRRPNISSPLEGSLEKLPTAQDTASTSFVIPRGPQVRDPVDIAVEKFVEMGFDEDKAKKALADSDNGDRVNIDKALKILRKQKKNAASLERLNKMG